MPRTRSAWRERMWQRIALLVLSSLVLACTQVAVHAGELLVLTSTTPGLEPGDVKETGSTIEVLRNGAVTLVAASGGVLRIEGPWRGRIDAPDSEGGLIEQLVSLFRMPPPRQELGASRGLESCIIVDPNEDRDVCVGPSTCVVFESGEPGGERIVIEGPDLRPIEVPRSPVRRSWSWPKDLPLKAGTYRIRIDADRRPTELRIHQRPQLPSDAHDAAWMSEVGCTKQAWEALSRLGQ